MNSDNLLNSIEEMFQTSEDLVIGINEIYKCKNCAGDFDGCECKYCGTKDKDLDNLLQELNNQLLKFKHLIDNASINEIPNNKFFNLLTLLKDRNILLVDELLKKYDYINKFQQIYDQANEKMKTGTELDGLELHAVETKIISHEDPEKLKGVYNYFITNALLGNQNVSYETFKVIIKKFTEVSMSSFYGGLLKPICIITDEMEPDKNGSSFFNLVRLNDIDVKNFYERNGFELLICIAHEMQHGGQYRKIFIDKDLVMQPGSVEEMIEDHKFMMDKIKEFVIFDYNKEYYRNNYSNISFELEAEIHGIKEAIRYIKSLGLVLSEKALSYWEEKICNLEERKTNRERILNGDVTTLDDVFEKIIVDHPEILSKYYQLNLLYKIEGNKVVQKNDQEKQCDLEAFLAYPGITSENQEFFKAMYKFYLSDNRNI